MKRIVLAIIVVSLALVLVPDRTESATSFTIAPEIQRMNGSTDYTMEISEVIARAGTIPLIWTLKSELNFPLDLNMAGVRIGLTSTPARFRPWSVEAAIYTNISDPSVKMEDHDWQAMNLFFNEKFSFTKSDARVKATMVEFEASLEFYREETFSVSLLGGFRYYHVKQDIIGYEGWFRPFDPNNLIFLGPIAVQGDEKAIFYKVTYRLPKAGIRIKTLGAGRLMFQADATYTRVMFSDFDDHILRGKTAECDGSGHGILAKATIHYLFKPVVLGRRPFVALSIDFAELNASGEQTQKWYADEGYEDPDTGEWIGVEAGDVFPGVPHEINSTIHTIGLRAGLEF